MKETSAMQTTMLSTAHLRLSSLMPGDWFAFGVQLERLVTDAPESETLVVWQKGVNNTCLSIDRLETIRWRPSPSDIDGGDPWVVKVEKPKFVSVG